MHILDQSTLGIAILLLLALLVIVKRFATGSILDKPQGNFAVQIVNIFNLFFLLVVNPLAAVLLITGRIVSIDPSHITITAQWLVTLLEAVGLVLYVTGFFLMAWALNMLGRNYQLGGSVPRPEDKMILAGPYRLVRHPMYTAALSICLGLAFLLQLGLLIGIFVIYLALIISLIPIEENALRKAYGEQYQLYQQKTRKLIPFIY